MAGNKLYFGDNLDILREHVADGSVDLIYLDPPFNSDASYNVLFKSPEGGESQAQIEAFDDSWHWSILSEQAFDEVMQSGNLSTAELLRAIRNFLGENAMMAYLAMMAIRLLELHRVLKDTGTLYLHCDPTASHYLKLVLDSVFGAKHFGNEISWKRSQPKSHTSVNFSKCRDIIFRYTKGEKWTFNKVYTDYDPEYVKKFYKFEDDDGRIYRLGDITNPNKNRPNLTYEFLGVTRVWRWTKERMQRTYEEGRIVQSKPGAVPAFKRYFDEMPGQPVTDNWTDITQLHGSHAEFLGYPTQKPLALLERIIEASSNEGDVVLDPFCGCGTAVDAAQTLNRQWIGIDITHLAVSLIERRLNDRYGSNISYEVIGTPKTIAGARDLALRDKFQFEWWAVSLVDAQPAGGRKKGADKGVDGIIYFKPDGKKTERAVVSVKGGKNIGVAMIRDLKGVMEREEAPIGVFITLNNPTAPMVTEAASSGFYETEFGKYPRLQILTIEELLDGKLPLIPLVDTGTAFRKASRDDNAKKQKKLDL